MHKISFSILFPLLLLHSPLISAEIHITCPDGTTVSLDVDNQARFFAVVDEARNYISSEIGTSLTGYIPNLAFAKPLARFYDPRDYWNTVNQTEKDAIRYIILTLGNEPLYKLYKYEGEMSKAAERFKTVHPLNLWREIFTSKDTISALVNARSRKLVWKPFMKGMADSLQEAYDGENLKDEYVADTAAKIGINPELIKIPLKNQDWSGFVQALIDNAKKSSNDDRYNI